MTHSEKKNTQKPKPTAQEVLTALGLDSGHDPEIIDDALLEFFRAAARAKKLYEAEYSVGPITRDIQQLWEDRVSDACYDLGIERTSTGLLNTHVVLESPDKESALRVIEAENKRPYRRKPRPKAKPKPKAQRRHLRLVPPEGK